MAGGRVHVDELDFRILREVLLGDSDYFRADRVPADEVARKLGVHRKTVAARLRKLTDGEVFLPTTLDIEPGMVGLVGAKAFLPVPAERRTRETREALLHVEGLTSILFYADGWDVLVYAEDETALASRIALAKALTGTKDATLEIHTSRDYPPTPPAKLTPLDVRLIVALLRNARAPFPKLAKTLGVTARTLERRHAKLTEQGVIMMLPGGTGDFEGVVTGYLGVDVPREEKGKARAVNDLLRILPNHFIRNLATTGRVHFYLYGASLADLEAQVASVRKVPGAKVAAFRLSVGAEDNPGYADWLARVLERRIAGAQR